MATGRRGVVERIACLVLVVALLRFLFPDWLLILCLLAAIVQYFHQKGPVLEQPEAPEPNSDRIPTQQQEAQDHRLHPIPPEDAEPQPTDTTSVDHQDHAEPQPEATQVYRQSHPEPLPESTRVYEQAPFNPSSSSPYSISTDYRYKYDVYVSFRGADTRDVLVNSFVDALLDAGMRVFRDHEHLQIGDNIASVIFEAIRESIIYIPIFSSGYASSIWCLGELVEMVQLIRSEKRVMIPIFYDVNPSDVRHQTGEFGGFFSRHEKRHATEKVQGWRDALREATSISGWDLRGITGQHEVFFKENIVPAILKLRLGVRHIVGMDGHEEKVMELLETVAPAARIIGIWGMGGIGKTTIAKYVYDRLNGQFDCSCSFISDNNGKSLKVEGMKSLRNLFADDGDSVSRYIFQDKKVLVLLDDVDQTKAEELHNLVKNLEKCGIGSRFIVTTRDIDILRKAGVKLIYDVPEMHEHDAFTLFCKHAFGQDSPPTEDRVDWGQLSWKIVEATGRLPLAIETMGSYLACKTEVTWQNALSDLETKQTIQHKLETSLEISYKALDDTEQEIFLDIACIFVGMDKRIPVHAWKARKFSPDSVEALRVRSLIKVGDDDRLWMHDHLRDLGREIVRRKSQHELGKQSRLWCGEDVQKVLRTDKATSMIEAIHVDSGTDFEAGCFSGPKLDKLLNLWYLGLAKSTLVGNFEGRLLNLRWLGWQGGEVLDMPSSLHLEKLVVLDLSKSKITGDWFGWSIIKCAVHLEVLNLTSCNQLTTTPDFSSFQSVKRLILGDCLGLTTIDPSIGHLKTLEFLDLKNCLSLKELPPEFESLHSLMELLIDGSSIQEIPISSGMQKLEILSAKSCKSLTEIPECIGQLKSLKELSLSNTTVTCLPDSIGELGNLKALNIDHCPIRIFPRFIGRLEKLEVLNASQCLNLTGEVPPEVGSLKSLRILRLDHTSITSIPASIVGLSHLDTLDLEWCTRLESVPDLPRSLVNLKVTRSASSVGVPNLAELINLKHLELFKSNSSFVLPQSRDEGPSPASSVDPPKPGYEYEVFLSFRGPDTRKTFTDVLHHDLLEAGIRSFRDDDDLHHGKEIGRELEQAIEQSRIFIPIFSKGYASSKWCLREATRIMKSIDSKRQQVLPIFYDVGPDVVKDQSGTFEEAFSKHMVDPEIDGDTVEEWRVALQKIGRIKGWDLTSPSNSYEGEAIKEVVSDVWRKLKKPFLDVSENIVGIEDQVENVMKLLDIRVTDVRMVGICGISGIGKTTIAKFIYNQLPDLFDYCCFLDNIRDTSSQHKGLESLQGRLASSTLRRTQGAFSTVDEGISVLEERLKSKKVLVLLDDVNQTRQLNALARDLTWFGEGSRIIITTREQGVLEEFGVKLIHKATELHPLKAFLLFCKHAFRQNSPLPHLAELAWKISEATGRIPLVIEAIGSFLSSKTKGNKENMDAWQEALATLVAVPGIEDKLKISYDALSPELKEVFLDIACLFIGMHKNIPIHIWKAQGYPATTIIQELHSRSLIKIGYDNVLWMHDCLRDLGRKIVRGSSSSKLGKQSRLWCSKDAMEVLTDKKGTPNVKAIYLDRGVESEPDELCLSRQMFENLSNLWFLELGDANLIGDFERCLSSLKWLSWHGQNLLNIPFGFLLKNLIILDLSKSWISEDWMGWAAVKEARKLEVLNLTGCHQLKRAPNCSSFTLMKKFIVKDCSGLNEIDQSIRCLQTLELLDLRNCRNLKKLPKELGDLKELKELLIDETSIQEIPISTGMSKLEALSANFCRSLTQVPPAIGKLKLLKKLSLSHTGVIKLPDSMEMLISLEVLNIDHCPVQKLPLSLGELVRLEEINASGCINLIGGVPDLQKVQNLRILRLDQTRITRIPESISKLPLLQTLGLKGCRKLQYLPNLPISLVDLKVSCTSSVTIPNFSALINLKQLEVLFSGGHAQVLKAIETFSKIEKLAITIKPVSSYLD